MVVGKILAKALGVTLLLCTMLLAGCSDTKETASLATFEKPTIDAGKGAITGLVIDDRYRPVADALVLLTPLGLTTTTDSEGQFEFGPLEPGAYVLQANADLHEAAPLSVDVVADEYAEVEIPARRIFSTGGLTITTQYSVFSPCMTSVVAVTVDHDFCMPDSSGDTFRPGITVDFRNLKTNLTYLVSEIKLNQHDEFVFVVRCAGGGSFGCGEFAYVDTNGADYGKLIMQNPGNYMHTRNSVNFTNKAILDGLLFYYGSGGDTITQYGEPVGCMLPPTENPLNGKPAFCREFYGAGNKLGVKAKIVMTAFIGPPDPGIDIATYNVLGSK